MSSSTFPLAHPSFPAFCLWNPVQFLSPTARVLNTIFLDCFHSIPCSVSFTLLLLLLSRFSRVGLCATPWTAAYQASPSMGFSRQEHWSGLLFPSPMCEGGKWKWSRSVVSDSATPWTAAYQAPPSMGFSGQQYWSGVPLPSPVSFIKFSKK